MKYLNLKNIDEYTPMRTSFYLRTKGERYANYHYTKNIYFWGNIILPPIKLKTIYHLPIYVLQIIKSTPDCKNWSQYSYLCPRILTDETNAKKYMFKIYYFKYENKMFAIEIFENEIGLYIYNDTIKKLTPIEQIPTEFLNTW